MRDYLRRTTDEIWVIDCSPEGHQPAVNTRIFEAMQQPVCIVLAARSPGTDAESPAIVRFRALPPGRRTEKFAALAGVTLDGEGWTKCSDDWRAPFLPTSAGAWSTYPALEELFVYNGSGVQPKRTWVIAPDAESLVERWRQLIASTPEQKEHLFHATLRDGKPADRHVRSIVREALPGFEPHSEPLSDEKGPCPPPMRYGFRSFNRQWIIPDARVITQPNAELWASRSDRQVYLTALSRTSPSSGPALTVTGLVPDLDHYKGSFGGRAFPLWLDRGARIPNVPPALLEELGRQYGHPVSAEDLVAYIAGVAAHPAFPARFRKDLVRPGLRIPITAKSDLFREAVELGRTVVWLHTFGERFADSGADRPSRPPHLPPADAPRIPVGGAIPSAPGSMPDIIDYDAATRRLIVGQGYVENVSPTVWNYDVSGKQVLRHWFSYRKATRERPIIGTRRTPSSLGDIQPEYWLSEYTTELIDLLHVLGRLVALEPKQAEILERICTAPTLSSNDLRVSGALAVPATYPKTPSAAAPSRQATLPD